MTDSDTLLAEIEKIFELAASAEVSGLIEPCAADWEEMVFHEPTFNKAILALITRERKAAVEEAFSRLLHKQDKAPVTQWSEVHEEMFPPPPNV